MLGDRRHKDELDSGDDSDNGRHDNDEVKSKDEEQISKNKKHHF